MEDSNGVLTWNVHGFGVDELHDVDEHAFEVLFEC